MSSTPTPPETEAQPAAAGVSLRTFPCRECGAPLAFAPGTGRLSCQRCGTLNELPQSDAAALSAAREELDYQRYLARAAGQEPQIDAHPVVCPGCGAQTQFGQNIVASRCAFCATPIVSAQARSRRMIQPRLVAPFKLTAVQAQAVFAQWIGSRWFAPNALKRTVRQMNTTGQAGGTETENGARGVYLPYWTFDAASHSSYSGQKGIHRTETETRTDANGQQTTQSRTVTDWYAVSGQVHLAFDDQLVIASPSVPEHLANVLDHWDLSALQPYSDDFVAGFVVEAYQRGLEPGFEQAKVAFDAAIEQAVRRDIGGDEQRIHRIDTQFDDIRFKHILLPAWISAYQFNGKRYNVVVNGQTGEVEGDRPYSVWKILFAVLAALLVVGLIYMFAGGMPQ